MQNADTITHARYWYVDWVRTPHIITIPRDVSTGAIMTRILQPEEPVGNEDLQKTKPEKNK